MSNPLWPHGLQHTRPPCPSPSPRACSNSYPLSWWCHPIISSFVIPFFSSLQSFPESGSFPMSWLFRASASASGLPMDIQGWFLLGLIGLISLLTEGLSRVFSNTTTEKHQLLGAQPSLWSNSHIHTRLLDLSLLFNMLSRFVIAFLPKSNHLLISWLQSPSTVILEPKKRKSVTASTCTSLRYCYCC